jgi:sedoheptulokinase
MYAAGIDVGTTNLELTLADLGEGRIRERRFAPNRRLPSTDPCAFLQDPAAIAGSLGEMLESVQASLGSGQIGSIGVTGQVHGILYTDEAGKPLSPLYTWLDRHGTETGNGPSPQELLAERTGVLLPPGYGLLTHYANRLYGRTPPGARRILGINELVTGALIGKPLDRTDATNLACFGGFDPVTEAQNPRLLEEALGPRAPAFLTLAPPFTLAGETRQGVPVAYPLGDNQAGFFGSIPCPEESCLVSIGTSGQISLYAKSAACPESMELRPYLGLGFLWVGAVLCAGKAYEALAGLFQEVLRRAQVPGSPPADDELVYGMMREAAEEVLAREAAEGASALRFDTAFNGSRRDPPRRGSISGIGLDNLTVGHLALENIRGIVRELAEFTRDAGAVFDSLGSIVVSGSAARKNRLFTAALEERFQRRIRIPPYDGGPALGAALTGAVSAGRISLGEVPAILERFGV